MLGASGSVARAFLRRLPGQRRRFGRVFLLDRNTGVLGDRYVDLRDLQASFLHERLRIPGGGEAYRALLRRHRIGLVVDLTGLDTIPLLQQTDEAGVSLVNTALCVRKQTPEEAVHALFPRRVRPARVPHILGSGMNPGAVNLWVRHGIERHGVPREVVHFEYDTSMTPDRWRPIITWSKSEFLAETAGTPSGFAHGAHVEPLLPDAMAHPASLRPYLEPILPLPHYPAGFTILHEENLTMARRYGFVSRFIYALHPRTTRYLLARRRAKGRLAESDLVLGDNIALPLEGDDLVGVALEYRDRRVCYWSRMPNEALVGTNATCAQVAIGLWSAVLTLLTHRLPPEVHFAGDLYDTPYRRYLFDNLRTQEAVFVRRRGGLVLRARISAIVHKPARREGRVYL